jgi:hypothetical protein
MRSRDISKQNGRLLACCRDHGDLRAAGVLFLVSSYADVPILAAISEAVDRIRESVSECDLRWFDVTDEVELRDLHAGLNAGTVLRVETSEFDALTPDDLEGLLADALARVTRFEAIVFPQIGAALGVAAEGVQFIGRGTEIKKLSQTIEANAVTLLVAPRRTGKTSLMREFVRRQPGGTRAAYVDLESAFDWNEAVVAIVTGVTDAEGPAIRSAIGQRGANAVLQDALQSLRSSQRSDVLFVDEFVYFLRTLTTECTAIERPLVVRQAIDALTSACESAGIHLVLAGSIDLLDYLTEEVGIEREELPQAIGGAAAYALPALEATPGHIRALLIGTGLVPEASDAEWLRANIDLGMPLATLQYLERLAVRVREGRAISTAELGAALDEFLEHTTVFRDVMDRFQQRGFVYPGFRGAVSEFMRRLLASSGRMAIDQALQCFNTPGEQRPQDALRWVVENLPVRIDQESVVLASKVFGRWWSRHHR